MSYYTQEQQWHQHGQTAGFTPANGTSNGTTNQPAQNQQQHRPIGPVLNETSNFNKKI